MMKKFNYPLITVNIDLISIRISMHFLLERVQGNQQREGLHKCPWTVGVTGLKKTNKTQILKKRRLNLVRGNFLKK